MKLLFNRVYDGADEMYAIAEKTVNETLAELGANAPVKLPDTAYLLANISTYL
jgi:acetyl-CoA synthase